MPLARILVDGYSLLHGWPALAPGRARHSAAAREELVAMLTRYQDAAGTPITIFFDGSGKKAKAASEDPSRTVEVLFSNGGWTADQMIERTVHRFLPHGEVLVITDDNTERDVVIGLGGMANSCDNFICMVESAMNELRRELKNHNMRERHRYQNAAKP